MVKKSFLLSLLFVFMFLTSGCITVCKDGCCPEKNPAQCTKKPAKTETGKETNAIEKADDWVKANLW
jgi:hypothetical protein